MRCLRDVLAPAALAAAVLVGQSGCNLGSGPGTGPAPGPGGSDPLQGIELVEANIEPAGPASIVYGGPVRHELQPSEQAILDALSHLPVRHLPALSRMTREVARAAPDHVNIPPALLDGLMAWAGLPFPQPRLVLVQLPEDPDGCHRNRGPGCDAAIASLVEQVQAQLPDSDHVHVGVGVARATNGATRLMVAVLEQAIELEPFPTRSRVGSSVALVGRLLEGRSRPDVEVVGPDGRMSSVSVSVSVDGSFRAQVPCGPGRGVHQVEVLAEGPHGPEVAANFPLHCGVAPPSSFRVELERVDPGVSAAQLAHANFVYLNEERSRRGLPELAWDERAAEVARAHSMDMVQGGFVGHRSPRTGDVRARFDAARIRGSVIRENVARGYGPKGIHESLMSSPGHRINILAPDVTHVGIGVVIGPAESNVAGVRRPLFTTQNFFRKPGVGAPKDDALVPTLQMQVAAAREARKLSPPRWSSELTRAAEGLAKVLARGRPAPVGWEQKVFEAGYQSVEMHQVESADFEPLTQIDLWASPQLEAGVAFARTGGADDARLLMIVVVGQR